jgi:hypothetical protein
MVARNHKSHLRLSKAFGALGIVCALLGFLAWIEYGTFAMRGINAVIRRRPEVARRMAVYADALRLAQVLLALLAIGLGWAGVVKSGDSRLARRLGIAALGTGLVVLGLWLLIV